MNRHATKSYNQYFDGFSEREVVTSKGKVKIERFYTGAYYREDVPDDTWKRRKWATGGLYAMALLLYFACGTVNCEANSCWYVILFSGITLAAVIFATINVVTKLTAQRDMIARVYRSASEQYQKRVRFTSVTMLLTAGAVLVNMVLNRSGFQMKAMICLAGYAFSGLTMLRLYQLEEQNQYCQIKNDIKLKDWNEFVEITY
ncbi:MAG: hypothetical protein LUI87_18800 [Lachnospiraceae bacterium]|nr:hypothetical protein [Lachnospiraceae bacterium]